MEVKDIQFRHPCFIYIVGKSEAGKTFFVNELVRNTLKSKFKIVYIVNDSFEVEKPIIQLMEKNEKVFVIKCKDLSYRTMDFLTKSITSKDKKLLIIDNFTYSLTPEMLEFTTYSRKYNASVAFIGHSFFSNRTISPRLRELVSYFILFYLPTVENLNRIMPQKLIETFEREITFRSFRFLLIDQSNSTWLVSKLPEFTPKMIWDKKKNKDTKYQ